MLSIGGKQYGDRPLIMGILNITPDSFYDGGRYVDRGMAVERALAMVDEGADIIDIGGESSRPGSEEVGIDVECARIVPVIERLVGKLSVPLSVDTIHAEVARRASDAGASIINDISALRADHAMAELIAERGLSVILMHMQGIPRTMQVDPQYENVVEEILAFLSERVSFAGKCGIPRDSIVVDPGIGFGKTLAHNLAILRDVARFHETGCPVLIGASRKSLIGIISGDTSVDRMPGTAAITAHCVMQNVLMHRVHDVRAMRQVCDVAYAIRTGMRTAGDK